jgi:hypothetical protein
MMATRQEFEDGVKKLVYLGQEFGIFVERELVTRRIKDKVLRDAIVVVHGERMQKCLDAQAEFIALWLAALDQAETAERRETE